MGPAPMTTTSAAGQQAAVGARAARVRSGCTRCRWWACDEMMQEMGSAMAAWAAGRSVVRQRQQAVRCQDLLADEDVLREQPRQRVAHGDLGHAAPAVPVALAGADGGMVDGRLHGEALAGPVSVREAPRRPPRA